MTEADLFEYPSPAAARLPGWRLIDQDAAGARLIARERAFA